MSVADRRRRERANRLDQIIAAARDLAEAEGWEAVTTRRLAALVEYSQPVLYSHFDRARRPQIVRGRPVVSASLWQESRRSPARAGTQPRR